MKKEKIISLGLLALITAFSSCDQGGATYKIVDTNQTKCFDDRMEIDAPSPGDVFYGQDAQHVGNTPSYTNNGDGTITDNVTGLMWQKSYKIMSMSEALNMITTFKYAGYNDWRIPSIKEAYSLILFSGSDVSPTATAGSRNSGTPFIDTDYFDFEYGANGSRAIDTQMLSSSLYVGSTDTEELVFGVNFADGRIKGYGIGRNGEEKQFLVRFVRGEEYGINNFTDNGDGTISDKATKLMWSQDDSQEAMNWQEALAYAEEMNSRNYRGHSDWRVPNAKELQSIVDYSRSPLTTSSAAIDPIFNVSTIKDEAGVDDYPFYWTSTTHENSAGEVGKAAVYVTFGRSLGNMSNSQGMMMGGNMGNASSRQGQQAQRQGQNQGDGQQRQGMSQGQGQERTNNGERPAMGERPEMANGERPEMANGERPERGSGDRQAMGEGQQRQGMRQGQNQAMGEGGQRQAMGEGQQRQGMRQGQDQAMGEGGQRQAMGNRQSTGGQAGESGNNRAMNRGHNAGANWVDIHGAGAQRSDPKSGDASIYASGHGPQGDAIRIYNYVRLVRDL